MGFGIYPVFNPSISLPDELSIEGVDLLEALEKLDKLASHGKVELLSSFADTREVPEDFEGDPDEALEMLGPWNEWFQIQVGLNTCNFLLEKTSPKSTVHEELEILKNALTHAYENGCSLFRFEAG
jgi:hypothetical protein